MLATLVMVGCNNPSASVKDEQQTVTYTDDYGTTVDIPLHPKRIVSTSPAVTEIIYALGGSHLLVGRTDFCSYPPEVADVESIGGISNLNIEKIMSLSPDLVISGSMIPKKSTVQMGKMGVPTVCVIEQKRYDGLYDNISKIGKLIGRTAAADSLNDLLRAQLSDLDLQTNDQPKSVYYVVGFGPSGNFTAGGDSFINDIIKMAGGRNIAEELQPGKPHVPRPRLHRHPPRRQRHLLQDNPLQPPASGEERTRHRHRKRTDRPSSAPQHRGHPVPFHPPPPAITANNIEY